MRQRSTQRVEGDGGSEGRRRRGRVGGVLVGIVLLLMEVQGGRPGYSPPQGCVVERAAASVAASSSREGLGDAGWGGGAGWAPAAGDRDPWLVLDAGVEGPVLGLATKGSWVSSFRASSLQGASYVNQSGSVRFLAPSDGGAPLHHFFSAPVQARHIKVFPELSLRSNPSPLHVALLLSDPDCGAHIAPRRRLTGLVDECTTGAHSCSSVERCVDTADSYVCKCNAGYSHIVTLDGTAGQAMRVLNNGTVDGGGLSIAVWFAADTTTNAQSFPPVISCADADTGIKMFTFTSGSVVGFNNGTSSISGSTTQFQSQVWKFIGATWNTTADKVTFYSDSPGSTYWADASVTVSGGYSVTDVYGKNISCTVGQEGTPNDNIPSFMTGRVRRAMVWDTFLSQSQMESAFYTGMDVESQSVIAWLDAGSCEAHDECNMSGLNRCSNTTTCVEKTNEYSCDCVTGHEKTNSYECTDVDECSKGIHICGSNAQCTNTQGAFTCACNSGYSGNGISCGTSFGCPETKRSDVTSCYVVDSGDKIVEFMDQSGKDMDEAKAICEAESGRFVASIANQAEQDLFSAQMKALEENQVWLGMRCNSNEFSSCEWHDGSTDTYSLGFSASSNREKCTRMRLDENAWWDISCSSTYDVACSQKGTSSSGTVGTCEATFSTSTFTCNCSSGVSTCQDISECEVSATRDRCAAASKGYCSNTVGSFACGCNPGYTLGSNARDCTNKNECDLGTDNCAQSNSACTDTEGSFTCACNAGWSGDWTACANINECSTSAHNCGTNATCVDTDGSFTCACNTVGYGPTTSSTECPDWNECASSGGPNNCHVGAACTNTAGSFTCSCNAGWSGNGTSCTNINECSTSAHNCGTKATCVDTDGSFTCACNTVGYGPTTSSTECPDWNECTSSGGPNNCHVGAACTNTAGSFTCSCNAGWSGDGDGTSCTNINECDTAGSCASFQTCSDTNGSFVCTCAVGYNSVGKTCPDKDECAQGGGNNCHANAACNNTNGSFTCACNAGYAANAGTVEGTNCSNVDECSGGGVGHSCTFSQATCSDSVGSFDCGCNSGYSLSGSGKGSMSCPDVDECAVQSSANASCGRLGLSCLNTVGSFSCSGCQAGFEFNGTGCDDIDECARGTDTCAAPPGGVCNNTIGGFNCSCAPLYVASQGRCINTNVPRASQQSCPTSGEEIVTIIMPSVVSGEVLVRFSEGGTGVAAVVQEGGKAISATCPSVSAALPNGKGQVYTPSGSILGAFDFDYVVPPPILTPNQVPLVGGTISLSVHAMLPTNCTYKFGAATAAAPAPTASSSLPSVMSIVVPPSTTGAGTAPVSISCLGGLQQAYVTYVAPPTVSSIDAQGECETLSPCTVVATISNPPATLVTADDVTISLSGLTEVAGGGATRSEVLSVGGSTAVLRITTPSYLAPGLLKGSLVPNTAPAGFTVAQATASFNFTVTPVLVAVTSFSPASGSTEGGTAVRMTVTGLPPASPSPSVWFGASAVTGTVTVVVSDLSATILDVTTPAASTAGTVFVSVGSLWNATATDSAGLFAYQSAGLSAACAVCEVGVQGGTGVTMALTGFAGPASAISASVVGGGTPTTIASFSGGVAAITFPAWTGGESADVLVSAFAAITEGSRTAYAQFYYRLPPKAVSFTFSSDGSKLYLVFDQKTNMPSCTPLMNSVADKLGDSWSCSWSASDKLTLTVVFGSGATLGVGDTLTIPANTVGDEKGITLTSSARRAANDIAVNASASSFPIAPTITVSAPKDIGVCDTAQIQVEGASPRPMTFVWKAPLDASLNAVLSTLTTGSISLAASLLPMADIPYEITVNAVTFLGGISETQSFTIAKRSLPPPLISILFPAGPMYRTVSNDLTASAEFSACLLTQAPVSFTWALTAAAPPASASNPTILNSSTSTFTIPPGTLTPGTAYYLRLFAVQSGAGSTLVDSTLTLDKSPLQASILGGSSRTVGAANTVTLDASSSLDPDACPPPQEGEPQEACGDTALAYSWGCKHTSTGDPCRLKATSASVAIAATAVTSLDISTVTLPSEGGLTVTLEVSKGSRTASAEVELVVEEGEVLNMEISIVKQSATRLSLRGSGSTEGYKWDMAGVGLVAAGTAASPTWSNEELVSTGWGGESFGLQVMDAVESGALRPGETYTVSLSPVTSSGAKGGSSFSFTVGLPPSGGTCALSLSSGSAMQTDFEIKCSTWSSDALPLSYSYGIAPADTEVSWTPNSFKSTGSFRLQAGDYNASARVYDSNGMWATMPAGAFVVSDPVLVAGETVEGAISDAAEFMDGLGQDSGMTMVAESAAAGLYDDTCRAEGTCGGRRRLLASSAAYRMRVRRLLLAKVGGGAGKGVSTKTVGSVLSAASSLSAAPSEVGWQGAQDSTSMLTSSTTNMLSDQLRSGGLTRTLGLCNSTVGMSEWMRTKESRDRVLLQTTQSMVTSGTVLVRSMTSDEVPFNVTFASVGIWTLRLRRSETEVSLADFYKSSFTLRSPNSFAAGTRRAGTDGVGFIAAYIAGTWDPYRDTLSRSQVVGLVVVEGGPVAPPLPETVTKFVPSSCPLSMPDCITITLRIPVPESGISLEQVNSGQFTRCLWWESSGTSLASGSAGVWRQNCTHVVTEVKDKFAHATCGCPKTGFYHADLVRPPLPRTDSVVSQARVGHSVHLWALAVPAAFCLVLAVLILCIALQGHWYMRRRYSHFGKSWEDASGSLFLTGKQTVMKLEAEWRKGLGLPAVEGGGAVLIADFGTVNGDAENSETDALALQDGGHDWDRFHSADAQWQSAGGMIWGSGGEESRMTLRRKRRLEDRAQWEGVVRTGQLDYRNFPLAAPASNPKEASLFKRMFSTGRPGSVPGSPSLHRLHHEDSSSYHGSDRELHHETTGISPKHGSHRRLHHETTGSSRHHGSHRKLHHELTGSSRHFVGVQANAREYDASRRRDSFLKMMALQSITFKSAHGAIIAAWEPPHAVPNQDGLWWRFPKSDDGEDCKFANHWVHWFGYEDSDLDVMPEPVENVVPVAGDADLVPKIPIDPEEQADVVGDNKAVPRTLIGNPTEYKMSKKPNPVPYSLSPRPDRSPPTAPVVPAVVSIGSDYQMETPEGTAREHKAPTMNPSFFDPFQSEVHGAGGEADDAGDSSDSESNKSTTAAETPKPRLFYMSNQSLAAVSPVLHSPVLAPAAIVVQGATPSPVAAPDAARPLESVPDPTYATSPANYVLQMTTGTPRDTEAKPTGMEVNGVPVVGGVLLPGRSAVKKAAVPPRKFGKKKEGTAPPSPDSWMVKQKLGNGDGGAKFNKLDIPTQGSGPQDATSSANVSPFAENKREWGQPVDFQAAKSKFSGL